MQFQSRIVLGKNEIAYSGVATLFRRKRELRPRVAGRDRVRRDNKSIVVQFGSALAYYLLS